MDTIAACKPSRRVAVRCVECGDIEQIGDRSYRRRIAEGKPYVCRLCRRIRTVKPTPSAIKWWKDNYTQEEIDEIANAMWG